MAGDGSRLQRWFAEVRRRKVLRVACAYAVRGDCDRAIELLDRAVRGGRGNLGWIENDPDLDALRGDPRFAAIVGRLRAAAAGAAS